MATHDVLSGYNTGVTRNIAMTTAFKQYLATQPAPPAGFEVYVKRGSGNNQDMFVWSWQPTGKLTLKKSSSNTSITNNHPCYDLAGTTFSVYSDPQCTKKVGDLVCKSDGTTNTLDLAAGTYYYKEVKAGKGYLLTDTGVHSVTVTSGNTSTITAKNTPGNDPLAISISKANASGIDDYDLSGTEFTIRYYDGYYNTVAEAEASGNPTRKWVIATSTKADGSCTASLRDSSLVAGSDPLYKDLGITTIPLGTIIVEETKAAGGFNNDCILKDKNGIGGGDPYLAQITMTTGQISLVGANGVKLDDTNAVNFGATDTRIRGDFEFTKTTGNGTTMAGVEFELVDKETGTVYPIVTDANGHYSSATDDTIWTGKETKAPNLGHLAYGEYTLREKECAANNGYELAQPIDFKIEQNNVVLNLGNVVNHKPEITTELTYEGIHMALAKKGIELTDTISYADFVNHQGTELNIHGWLMDVATGQAAVDDNGNMIVADTTATLNAPDGTITLTYQFDGETLGGKTFVSFVSVIDDGETDPFVSEEDLTNEDQMIRIPTGGTTATDENGTHVSLATEEVTINDVVAYKNLIPGKTYTATGTLMDKDTGAAFIDADGNTVTATTTFTATQPDGEVTVTFKFNATKITTRVVAFETVKEERSGVEVFVHADLEDEDQSVDLPKIVTTASDVKGADEHEALAEKNTMLTDYLDYENLNTNYQYHIVGKLMVSDGTDTGITAEATFTPAQANGTQPVLFAFDATPYAGKTLVVFEKVYVIDENGNEHEIANHEDLTDKKQSVNFPKAETTLMGKDTGDHTVSAAIKVTLIDYVKYTNLQTDGREYTVKGELYDKDTGKSLGITGETTFVPTAPDGVVEVEFEFVSTMLQGKKIVAFEDVYYENKKIATHADLEDEGQEVDIPDVGTKLLAEDTNAHTTGPKKVTLIDYVKYSNLYIGGVDAEGNPIPAKEYTIKGELYDQATGKSLGYTAETTFTPTKESGEVEVRFEVDASDMAGKSFVAFEELWQGDVKLAVHADITDKNQTVSVPGEMKTTATAGNAKVVLDTAGKTTITDTVKYSNLSAGTYELRAQLMDAQTGKAIAGATGTARFTVDALNPNGQVKVELSFDPAAYANHNVVVFEKMYIVTDDDKTIEISKHEDLGDKDQTIRVVHLDQPPKTGDNTPIELLLSLLAVSALGIALVLKKRKSYNAH